MISRFTRRGQPLVALVLVLGSWVSARAMMFDGSAIAAVQLPAAAAAVAAVPVEFAGRSPRPDQEPAVQAGLSRPPQALLEPDYAFPEGATAWRAFPQGSDPAAGSSPATVRPAYSLEPDGLPIKLPRSALRRRAPLFGLLPSWILPSSPQPSKLASLQPDSGAPRPAEPAGGAATPASQRRWSADAWWMWRPGNRTRLTGGILTPSYGASQAGGVLRYRLDRGSGHRPNVYLRTTAALDGSRESEASLGVSARPIARMPLVAAIEARYTHTPSGRMIRPAGFIVTELPPIALPMGLRGEVYGQAGYVDGKFATPFADGQLRADHALLSLGSIDMRLGAGAWGGAQKGAWRLDAGPSFTLARPMGRSVSMRLAADWRFRVAGQASPGSGPAVTLSAGF
jgi:hypothetical protein